MNGPKKRLYSISEAAIYLGLSVHAVRERIWAGQLPCVRLDKLPKREKGKRTKAIDSESGGRILLDINDLDKWIEERKTGYDQ